MSETRVQVRVGSRSLSFSNLDKVLWPRDGYTKGDLISYYRSIARWAIPHLRVRPVTLERFPNGFDSGSFFEKQIPKGTPEWGHRVVVPKPDGRRSQITYVVCDDEASLAYLANLAVVHLHVWTSRVASLDEPDFALFDLDPQESCTLKTIASVALTLRALLRSIGLEPLVKTSGGTGMHVVLPLARGYSYDAVKLFAELIAHRISEEAGPLVTLERSIAKRNPAAVYVD